MKAVERAHAALQSEIQELVREVADEWEQDEPVACLVGHVCGFTGVPNILEEECIMAASPHTSTIQELEALCSTCPSSEEVTAFLDTLGFILGFTMGAVPANDRNVAPLPAQNHYERDDGLCIIYLAGRDSPMCGEHFPAHQSRFWAYAGAESTAFGRITRALAVRWGFTWQRAVQDGGRPAQRTHVA